ncbi:alanine racemase [Angelakisella massiliensis]|uniref:alanine racemase n=1 Tax=Angelakisella massiliensis TaxID=1871018 RepID=UPI0023A8D9C3|nr:alanine racemase [Angelakisella massiliensis]
MKQMYQMIDTPSLIIDLDRAMENIQMMQQRANELGVDLRPHIKTHRMTYFAKKQMEAGAAGIACAKIGEAEVMAAAGIKDIFIANEIMGESKYERVRQLHQKIHIRVGVDNIYQIDQIEKVFAQEEKPLEVLMEYEVGENRSGIITDEQLDTLVEYILTKKHVVLKGIFSHEGHTYKASNRDDCVKKAEEAYRRTLRAADRMRQLGADIDTVSIGATPSIMNGSFLEGITELRLGTYVFFDLGQASAIGDFSHCAATVLTTIISKPTEERVVLDAGAKALVSQNRDSGICATAGFGYVKDSNNVRIAGLFDEHGLIYDSEFSKTVQVGDKIEVIPSHVCPTVNLYDEAVLVSNGAVVGTIPVDCRGKSK